MLSQHYQQQLGINYSVTQGDSEYDRYMGHKKLKKKKKKKDKRHKHHHKDKKRRREESSQESVGDADEGFVEVPKKIPNQQLLSPRPLSSNEPRINVTNQISSLSPHREPRTCVLRKIAERTPLQRLLEHLLRSMEKRDPQQFFAWPVTDSIAPGYSQIITNPMDFSTIKQKIDDNNYQNLNEFIDDFKLMCNNATTYNHQDTIYYKAAKKLLHVGLKMVTPEKLRQLRPVLTYMHDISKEELGFELGVEDPNNPDVLVTEEQIEREREQEERNEEAEELRKENQRKMRLASLGKFEAIPDDLTPEEILKQARGAAKSASEKLSLKRLNSKMGFLRQKKDGTTSLQIIVPGDGVIPGTNQRPVSLGQLIGKLNHGTGALAGFREDRRNMSKPVKPLYYGAFGSYAPSYDSTFANLTKEETDLVYQTYGDETAVQYAESILDFAKDCDYTLTMVDDLLDILTGGDHRKTKKFLEEKRRLKEEEEKIKHLLEKPMQDINKNIPSLEKVRVDIDQLKTLSELGIDMNFLEKLEEELKFSEDRAALQSRLDDTSQMLGRLKQVQHDRLSAPPPAHLSNVPKASETEVALADKITDNLTEIAKKLPPSAIAPVDGLRRAMGIAPLAGGEPMEVEPITHNPAIVTENTLLQPTNGNQVPTNLLPAPSPIPNTSLLSPNSQQNQTISIVNPNQMQIGVTHNQNSPSLLSTTEPSGVPDLESELREFLESDPTLGHSPLHDDKTLEDILSES
ncbi:bromodomain-containing protein 7 isoform X2 [Vespula pensylvanica]|nr:bromodomain-containing protein 7 isoform X2 [Vespula pensylvanica]XP_043672375.1 bromodomain-containing protein 7 isoform X2 [Vespula pensylvanica]XP_043672376.1 bromodomain-containing protein 7 isoform X2 [Vespula pensylvanica]XP_043672377.1 bromodomain-containing protein 7 isoform X2 [Vespula pensylvanica]XP_043672378.1 bromodomain-containing protein 7 isoform X2 [Vespula pensylvanica]XP_043672379.1 bromodomain-containing protein 7 isoform X2 [Vespula pensylvanica]XP_043672380.1 bromodom